MNSQKRENLLNLSLEAGEEEREKSEALSTGFFVEERKWELIVRYSGNIGFLEERGIEVEELTGGYGILTVPERQIDFLSTLPQIEYIEKPKELFYSVSQGRTASCINFVQEGNLGLSGQGILVGIIDSGIDYYHDDFRNEDGTTRILELWDQGLGRVFSEEEINEALSRGSRQEAREIVPSVDVSGHGTAVAGIAAGNGRGGRSNTGNLQPGNNRYRGVAWESQLIVVKLGRKGRGEYPWTTSLMRALDFVAKRAVFYGMPISINLSMGNTYGSHDGSSLLETFINTISNFGRNVIVVGTGNEGKAAGHAMGVLIQGQTEEVELTVGPYETSFGVQIWKSYADEFSVSLMTPSGRLIGPIEESLGMQIMEYRDTRILIYYGFPSPYSQAQEVYFEFIPRMDYIESGNWKFFLQPKRIIIGRYDMWLPSAGTLNQATHFLKAAPDTTLTTPSASAMAISVGAYNDTDQSYSEFSGRGFTRLTNQIKPDIAAPGYGIEASKSGGGYSAFTGTSFAAPFVTGSAALMMQWGIVRGNDPYLYGEKVKAYLMRGARQLPGYDAWPNPQLGYGALCVRDSLPN
ncbi:S8 family peptidase [Lachnospiraceae bacterium 62-35]